MPSIFERDGDAFTPTELARGPWDPQALHGGAPAALMAQAMQALQPGAELFVSRLTYEFLRPVPMAPLSLAVELVRPGRRVQLVSAALSAGDTVVCRATALRVAPPPAGARVAGDADGEVLAGPEQGRAIVFGLAPGNEISFASSAMEMRFISGDAGPGPATVWMRLAHPLLPGERISPLARAVASADFGNGVSAALDFERFIFINPDLTVYLHRHPAGEWVALDARTCVDPGAGALAHSGLHDQVGPIGQAVQSLLVAER